MKLNIRDNIAKIFRVVYLGTHILTKERVEIKIQKNYEIYSYYNKFLFLLGKKQNLMLP